MVLESSKLIKNIFTEFYLKSELPKSF